MLKDGWMDYWMDGLLDGWMVGMDGWMDRKYGDDWMNIYSHENLPMK